MILFEEDRKSNIRNSVHDLFKREEEKRLSRSKFQPKNLGVSGLTPFNMESDFSSNAPAPI